MRIKDRGFESEFIFYTSKSGGAGGQNVNKVDTKVELRFNVEESALLTNEEKALVKLKLQNRINNEGFLQLFCQAERSQLKNKGNCVDKFYDLISQALAKQKKRKPTKPSKAAMRKRLELKKHKSEKKSNRGFKADY